MPKISVIVPVYNVDHYLEQCLESIINQTFKDIEIICVNDGSTDNSEKILNEYKTKDNRIKIINQTNQGLSAARNTGIKYAQGEYVSFIDSDDYIDIHLYETLVSHLPAEMICFNAEAFGDGYIENKLNKNLKCKQNGLHKISDKLIFKTNVYAWNKLFKLDIIRKFNIEFPTGLYFEDFVFLWDYMMHIKKAYYLSDNKNYYFYRQRSTSIMSNCTDKSIHHLYAWHNLYERFQNNNLLKKHKKSINKLFEMYLRLAFKLSDKANRPLIAQTAKQYAKEINYKNIDRLIENINEDKIIYSNIFEKIFSLKNKERYGLKHKIITIFGFEITYAPASKKFKFPKNTKEIIFDNASNINFINKRICIFAGFNKNGKIPDYVIYYLRELQKVVDGIIFIADNPVLNEEIEKIKPLVIYAQFKRHNEYDFGSYKAGFNFALKNKFVDKIDEIIFCNDSCFGPVYPFKNTFDIMQNRKCDFWGLSSDIIEDEHVQSFFYVFKKNVFTDNKFIKFLNNVKHQRNIAGVIKEYEAGLTKYLTNNGYKFSTLIPLDIDENKKDNTINKTLYMPYTLISKYKFPLLKIKALSATQNKEGIIPLMNWLKENNNTLYKIIKDEINYSERAMEELN